MKVELAFFVVGVAALGVITYFGRSRRLANAKCVVGAIAVASMISCSSARADVVGLNSAMPTGTEVKAAPTLTSWTHEGGGIAYLFAGTIALDTPRSAPHTELAVGAQLNAYAGPGSHQIVFGIATEAWSLPGSLSMLTGLEATTINMEPENPWR